LYFSFGHYSSCLRFYARKTMGFAVFHISSYCTKYPSASCLQASNLDSTKVGIFRKLIITQSNFIFVAVFVLIYLLYFFISGKLASHLTRYNFIIRFCFVTQPNCLVLFYLSFCPSLNGCFCTLFIVRMLIS